MPHLRSHSRSAAKLWRPKTLATHSVGQSSWQQTLWNKAASKTWSPTMCLHAFAVSFDLTPMFAKTQHPGMTKHTNQPQHPFHFVRLTHDNTLSHCCTPVVLQHRLCSVTFPLLNITERGNLAQPLLMFYRCCRFTLYGSHRHQAPANKLPKTRCHCSLALTKSPAPKACPAPV